MLVSRSGLVSADASGQVQTRDATADELSAAGSADGLGSGYCDSPR